MYLGQDSRFLKSPAHPTVSMGVWGDMSMGYDVWYNDKDKSLYSQPNFTSTYKDRLPKFASGTEGYRYVQAGRNFDKWSRLTDDDMSRSFQDLVVRPQSRGGNTTEGNWKRQWSFKGEPGLEIVSPEFDILSMDIGGLKELKHLKQFKRVVKNTNTSGEHLQYDLYDWKGIRKGKINARTYDNKPDIRQNLKYPEDPERYMTL